MTKKAQFLAGGKGLKIKMTNVNQNIPILFINNKKRKGKTKRSGHMKDIALFQNYFMQSNSTTHFNTIKYQYFWYYFNFLNFMA